MVLVRANMPRFGFSPCKFFLLFLVPAKYFTFENSPSRDYFSNKWVQSSCATCANHHKNRARDQNQNETYLQGPKTKQKNYRD